MSEERMDNRNRKHFARLEPDLSRWVDDHAERRWQRNQSAVIREALIVYRAIVENDAEQVVKRMVGLERERLTA